MTSQNNKKEISACCEAKPKYSKNNKYDHIYDPVCSNCGKPFIPSPTREKKANCIYKNEDYPICPSVVKEEKKCNKFEHCFNQDSSEPHNHSCCYCGEPYFEDKNISSDIPSPQSSQNDWEFRFYDYIIKFLQTKTAQEVVLKYVRDVRSHAIQEGEKKAIETYERICEKVRKDAIQDTLEKVREKARKLYQKENEVDLSRCDNQSIIEGKEYNQALSDLLSELKK